MVDHLGNRVGHAQGGVTFGLLPWAGQNPVLVFVGLAVLFQLALSYTVYGTRGCLEKPRNADETLAFFETVLQHAGVTPRNIVRVPSFLVIPYLVQGTGSIALLQRRLAERLSASTSIRIMAPPLRFPKLEIGMWWSPAREHDPSHMWFRQLLSKICEKQFA